MRSHVHLKILFRGTSLNTAKTCWADAQHLLFFCPCCTLCPFDFLTTTNDSETNSLLFCIRHFADGVLPRFRSVNMAAVFPRDFAARPQNSLRSYFLVGSCRAKLNSLRKQLRRTAAESGRAIARKPRSSALFDRCPIRRPKIVTGKNGGHIHMMSLRSKTV